jgi:hypothetical protein
MKPTQKAQGFFDCPFAHCESRFEKADIGPFAEPSVQAHFGRTLKKIFPFSPAHSEPNEMHILLQKIQANLEKDLEGPPTRNKESAMT